MRFVKKATLINLIVLLISTSAALYFAERMLRFALLSDTDSFQEIKDPSIYTNYIKHGDGDFFNDNYWKLNYLFKKQFNLTNPDSLIGWVGAFSANSRIHSERDKVKERRPVLLYGDSFSQCTQSVECFEDILNSDTVFTKNHYLLNYGVGGFGVDQIYLLFNETVDHFENPYVIFGFLTTDMDRCMVSFRDAQKPYFTLDSSKLELNGTPIFKNSEDYVNENPPIIKSYLWNRIKNTNWYPFRKDKERAAYHIHNTKVLNEAILMEAFRKLKSLQTDYFVLLFHPEHLRSDDWRLGFLKDLLEREEIPYICDADIIDADTTFSTYDGKNYAIPGNGHPTTHLNKLISSKIKDLILDSN